MVFTNKISSEPPIKSSDEKQTSFKRMTMKERFQYMKEVITIEPLICCLVIAKMSTGPAIENLHFEKACKVNAGFNDTVCDAILSGTYLKLNFREQNNEVQSYLTQMRSWEVPVSSVVPVLLVLFLGSYSDKHKIRKPFLLMPIFGGLVAIIGTVINVLNMYTWPLEAQVIADRVIPSVFGSEKLVITISYAYIADISTPEMRTIRMAVIPIVLTVCIPVVQAVSGILFKAIGYLPILGLSFFLFLLAFLYGVFMVKEPRKLTEKHNNMIADIFNLKHVSDTFKLLIENKGVQRNNFICILVVCFLNNIVMSGEHSAFFLFAQTAYQWTVVDFSYLTSIGTVVKFIGLTVAVPVFAKVFKWHDLTIIIVSYIDAILASTVIVVVNTPIGLYIGCVISVLKPVGQAAARAQITKFVSEDDMAKALSLNTIAGAIAAALSAQIYHQGIYEHTRKTYPQAFLLFGIAMNIVGIAILLGMYWQYKKNNEIAIEEHYDEQIKKEHIGNPISLENQEVENEVTRI